MPPRARRPAAAVKLQARPGVLRRKRPASEVEEKPEKEAEVIKAAEVTVAHCRNMGDIEIVKGTYWEA